MANMDKIGSHETNVVLFNNNEIILDTGGFFSNTTKTRMNQISNQQKLGFRVYQKNYDWYVDFEGQTYKFLSNKITLAR